MKIRNGILLLFSCLVFIFLHPTSLQAAAKSLPMKTVIDAKKPWTITFNQPVSPGTINDGTVYILDDETHATLNVTMSVSDNLKEAIISPVYEYEPNKKYTVIVTDKVMNHFGEKLNEQTEMSFIVSQPNDDLPPNWEANIEVFNTFHSAGYFHLKWDVPDVQNVKGYYIYKRIGADDGKGDFTQVITDDGEKVFSTKNEKEFFIPGEIVSNKLYEFAISIVFEDGEESERSALKSYIHIDPNAVPEPEPVPIESLEDAVFHLTNEERVKEGLSPLKKLSPLMNSAREKSDDMSTNNYFSHTSPTYGSPFAQIQSHGISYKSAGENIGRGYLLLSPEAVVMAWMNSPGHRANILNSGFTHIGIGFARKGTYWTQQFIGM